MTGQVGMRLGVRPPYTSQTPSGPVKVELVEKMGGIKLGPLYPRYRWSAIISQGGIGRLEWSVYSGLLVWCSDQWGADKRWFDKDRWELSRSGVLSAQHLSQIVATKLRWDGVTP